MLEVLLFFGVILFLFTWLGLLRGSAKETLITFVVVLVLAINSLLRRYTPFFDSIPENMIVWFLTGAYFLIVLYALGNPLPLLRNKMENIHTQRVSLDWILSALFGSFNGYVLMGTIFYYAYFGNYANYPLTPFFFGSASPRSIEIVTSCLEFMPPKILDEPGIYFAVIVALIVFLAINTNLLQRLITRLPKTNIS